MPKSLVLQHRRRRIAATTTTTTAATTIITSTTLFLGYSNICDDIASSLTIVFTPSHYFSTGAESGIGIAFSRICSWIGTYFELKGNTTQRYQCQSFCLCNWINALTGKILGQLEDIYLCAVYTVGVSFHRRDSCPTFDSCTILTSYT
ncbi:uncharacterized protein [Cicer arietinum]|uniref:Uncharacterized protein LOC105851421 n=1 Tax=Cicer arietinum TaxID=3827 RepID=A0A3Q7Y7J7_CICAR|nr:uncharacterized protein LOC105851421 [Cicer arietinum]